VPQPSITDISSFRLWEDDCSSQSQSKSHITTDGRSVSMSWCRARFGTCDRILFYFFFFKVAVLSLWGALSDVGSDLSFVSLLSIQSTVVSHYLHKIFTLSVLDTVQ
jgi:hypothetical protein